ncbi:MAG: hypothetical protein WBW84_15730 [Acidobacteriaceae bacterium]
MAHWDDERDRRRVETMRRCGEFAIKHKAIIDKFEETGDGIYWAAWVDLIRKTPIDELLRKKEVRIESL